MVKRDQKDLHDDSDSPGLSDCVRVPYYVHMRNRSLSSRRSPHAIEEALAALSKAPGIKIVNDAARNHYPMPSDSNEHDDVLVGRVRYDLSCPNALAFFVCGDQLLKGAALNTVQIAELLI